ncbi:hypothetical protein JCM10207_004841 [Rhodosporidiobolus poonsookiae]
MPADASTDSPGDPTPFPDQTTFVPVKAASLAGLPVELQSQIAEYTFDGGGGDDCKSVPLKENQPDPSQTILALSLVNRHFYQLCTPLVWEALNITDKNTYALLDVIRQVLPGKARYVKHLILGTLRHWLKLEARNEFEEEDINRSYNAIEAAQSLYTGNFNRLHSLGGRVRQARALLDAVVLNECHNVRSVEYSSTDTWASSSSFFPVLDALVQRPAFLTSLDLEFPLGVPKGDILAAVIRSQPSLVTLVIDCGHADHLNFDRPALYSALATLSSLTSLTLYGRNLFDGDLFSVILACPLVDLALDPFEDSVSIAAIRCFVRPFTSTLRTVYLLLSSVTPDDTHTPAPLLLPHLESLDLEIEDDLSVLPYIFGSSLVNVNIIRDHNGRLADAAFVQFLDAHRDTLRTIKVTLWDAQDEAIEEALIAWALRQPREICVHVGYDG